MRARRYGILFILFIVLHSICIAQSKRALHWYFGWQAGIDFSSGNAKADRSGKLISIEGSAVIDDEDGNIIFYSNGEKVWNKNGGIMPNGTGILGNQSATQSSLIVPMPGNNSLFYLFTSTGLTTAGAHYHIIDKTLEGSLGDVISKNNLLLDTATEELAGTMHCNNRDYWIVLRRMIEGTLNFYAFLVTSEGLSSPVISSFSSNNPYWNIVGSLTFSQDGEFLAFCSFASDIYLFDFNKRTGKLSVKNKLPRLPNEYLYSTAISPDGKKLYVTSWFAPHGYNYIAQYDLTAADIPESRIYLDSADYRNGSPNAYGFIGQLKLGPDQKIYVSRWNQSFPYQVHPDTYYSLDSIDVIQFPDLQGTSCGFQRNFLYLEGKPTMIGLPNFISNFTNPVTLTAECKPDEPSKDSVYIAIYPNPFHHRLFVETNIVDKSRLNVRLIDVLGRVIPTSSVVTASGLEIKCGFLAAATYFIQVFDNKNCMRTLKVIAR